MPSDDHIVPVTINRVHLVQNTDTPSDQSNRRRRQQKQKETPRKDKVDLSAESLQEARKMDTADVPRNPTSDADSNTHIDIIIK